MSQQPNSANSIPPSAGELDAATPAQSAQPWYGSLREAAIAAGVATPDQSEPATAPATAKRRGPVGR